MSEAREFEIKMKRLEEIVSLLDTGDVALEDSLKLYKEGVQCARFCKDELARAKHEVEVWNMESDSGVKVDVPFFSDDVPF